MDPTWSTSTVIGLVTGALAAGGLATWVSALRTKVSQLERRLEQERNDRALERQDVARQLSRLAEKQGHRLGELEDWIARREAAESALSGRPQQRLPPRRPTEPALHAVPKHVRREDSGDDGGGED